MALVLPCIISVGIRYFVKDAIIDSMSVTQPNVEKPISTRILAALALTFLLPTDTDRFASRVSKMLFHQLNVSVFNQYMFWRLADLALCGLILLFLCSVLTPFVRSNPNKEYDIAINVHFVRNLRSSQ